MKNRPLSREDIEQLVGHCAFAGSFLSGRRWLITGGTGFFGKWLTQALCALHDAGVSRHELILWTRNERDALAGSPWLAGRKEISWHSGDIRAELPAHLEFDGVFHGATAASAALNDSRPLEMFDVIVEGTRNVLRESARRGCGDLLFVSSGGVYGKQPSEFRLLPEDFSGAPSTLQPASAYGVGKRAAEFLCAVHADETKSRALIARCFAFVGPYLPLDTHFAVGNFMRDVLEGKEIRIGGDGTPYRSYLYGSDLVEWLLKILVAGKSLTPYHVGSERDLSIAELARAVSKVGLEVTGRKTEIVIAGKPVPGAPPARYVPSTRATREALGVTERVTLEEGVARTLRWHASGKT